MRFSREHPDQSEMASVPHIAILGPWTASHSLACSPSPQCWSAMHWRSAASGTCSASQARALLDPSTDFSKEHGRSAWSRPSGRSLRSAAGGPTESLSRRQSVPQPQLLPGACGTCRKAGTNRHCCCSSLRKVKLRDFNCASSCASGSGWPPGREDGLARLDSAYAAPELGMACGCANGSAVCHRQQGLREPRALYGDARERALDLAKIVRRELDGRPLRGFPRGGSISWCPGLARSTASGRAATRARSARAWPPSTGPFRRSAQTCAKPPSTNNSMPVM